MKQLRGHLHILSSFRNAVVILSPGSFAYYKGTDVMGRVIRVGRTIDSF